MARSAPDQMHGLCGCSPESAPDAMLVVNQRGVIMLLNHESETQFGYRRGELLGRLVSSIIPDGLDERLAAACLRTGCKDPAPRSGADRELVARRSDATEFPVEVTLSHVYGNARPLVMMSIRDVSVRGLTELDLREKLWELMYSNAQLRHFACLTAHDLQEPLRTAAGYLELIVSRYRGALGDDGDDFIAVAADGLRRMQLLITQHLASSRVGFMPSTLVEVSSGEALQQAVWNLGAAIKEAGSQVTREHLPLVLADKTQLIQLFQNLVGNAIKYRRAARSEIHVRAVSEGERRWQFSVRDNGIGIEPQHFERIFGMFQRLNEPGLVAGTGVGLAVCRRIVEQHGGSLSVDSSPGHGSTFRFSLPGAR